MLSKSVGGWKRVVSFPFHSQLNLCYFSFFVFATNQNLTIYLSSQNKSAFKSTSNIRSIWIFCRVYLGDTSQENPLKLFRKGWPNWWVQILLIFLEASQYHLQESILIYFVKMSMWVTIILLFYYSNMFSFVVCEKSDGIRALLLITSSIKNEALERVLLVSYNAPLSLKIKHILIYLNILDNPKK